MYTVHYIVFYLHNILLNLWICFFLFFLRNTRRIRSIRTRETTTLVCIVLSSRNKSMFVIFVLCIYILYATIKYIQFWFENYYIFTCKEENIVFQQIKRLALAFSESPFFIQLAVPSIGGWLYNSESSKKKCKWQRTFSTHEIMLFTQPCNFKPIRNDKHNSPLRGL